MSQVLRSWSTKIAKINEAVVETASDFNLGVDEDEIEELLEVVPAELTTKGLLELEEERIAEEEAREKDTAGEEKEEEPPRKFTAKGLAEASAEPYTLLKKFENIDPTPQSWGLFMVHYLFMSKSTMKKRSKPCKPPWTYYWKESQEMPQACPSGSVPEEGFTLPEADGSVRVIAPEDLPGARAAEAEDSGTDDPASV